MISTSVGRRKNWRFWSHLQNIENWTTSMVSRSWSSGKFSQGRTTAKLLPEVQKFVDDELDIQLQGFEDRIIFMSMYIDIDWTRKDNRHFCAENSSRLSEIAKNFPRSKLDLFWSRSRKAEEAIVRWVG